MWMNAWSPGTPDNHLPWLIVTAVSLVAAAWDATQHRIPNWLTGPAWAAGLVVAGWVAGPAGLGDALLGTAVMSAPFVVMFLLGGGGAGDAKLMAALGAWLGFSRGTMALLCIALAGAVVAMAFAVRRRQVGEVGLLLYFLLMGAILLPLGLRHRLASVASTVSASERSRRAFPYGIAILAGTLAASARAVIWAR